MRNTEKKGFTFWESYYDAFKAAQTIGKGDEYLHSLLDFAFEGVVPETDDPFMAAFYSAAIPTIKTSMKNVRNGQKGGSKPTVGTHSREATERNGTEQNRTERKKNRKNISYVTPSYDSEAFKEEAQHVPVYKPKEGA